MSKQTKKNSTVKQKTKGIPPKVEKQPMIEFTEQQMKQTRQILEQEVKNPHFDQWKWSDEYQKISQLASSKGKKGEEDIHANAKNLMLGFYTNYMKKLDEEDAKDVLKDYQEYKDINDDLKAIEEYRRKYMND
jgi:hypothetical protein